MKTISFDEKSVILGDNLFEFEEQENYSLRDSARLLTLSQLSATQ